MLDKNPHPTDAQIRETMSSTLCRCFSHFRVQTAIKRVVVKGVARGTEDASPAAGREGLA